MMPPITIAQCTINMSTADADHTCAFPAGALGGAWVADHLGRRGGVFLATLVFAFGVSLQTGCHQWAALIVGRVFAGLGVGLVSVLIPMYQSECSPKWIRGAVVSGYQWAITIGLLLASVINNATKDRDDHSAWRIPTGIQLIWASILTAGMFYLPEVRALLLLYSVSKC